MALFRNLERYVHVLPKSAQTSFYARRYRQVAENYRFEKIGAHHFPQLMDLSKGFFEDESLTTATGSTIENCKKGMEFVLEYTIAAQKVANLSEICYEKKTNKPIGFRLASPTYRDPKLAPFSVPEPTLSSQEITLFTPLDETFDKIWSIFPNENVIIKGEILSIAREHRATGLKQTWMEYGVDYPTLVKQSGANIFAIMCTARATKHWFHSLGFKNSCGSLPYVKNSKGEQVMLPQGDIRVFTTNLRTGKPLNVKPIWDKMGLTE